MTQVTTSVNRTARGRNASRAAGAAAGAVLALLLGGCGGGGESADEGKAKTRPAAPPASASASADPAAGEKSQVLRAYDGYWAELVKAYAKADTKGTELKKYTELDALSRAQLDVGRMKDAGTVHRGKPGHKVGDPELALEKDIPTATLTDCLDISGWTPVRDGKVLPFPEDQEPRYLTTVVAEKWEDRWLITKVTPHGDRAC
ncbi:hypothetical protein [Streptomyces sp. NPDC058595]|uniref:hypothetical protein n=1 Tax=Streptomyces sp. NPDC058595 TaxID=3346550 RepID=UPI003667F709